MIIYLKEKEFDELQYIVKNLILIAQKRIFEENSTAEFMLGFHKAIELILLSRYDRSYGINSEISFQDYINKTIKEINEGIKWKKILNGQIM